MIVVDTNVIGYLYLSSERSAQAEAALRKDAEWVAPMLWRSELRNVLARYVRRRILLFEDAVRIMDEATRLMHGREYGVTSLDVLQCVRQSRCSAYDCEFVALARALRVPLVTVDRQILRDFTAEAISLMDFVGA